MPENKQEEVEAGAVGNVIIQVLFLLSILGFSITLFLGIRAEGLRWGGDSNPYKFASHILFSILQANA